MSRCQIRQLDVTVENRPAHRRAAGTAKGMGMVMAAAFLMTLPVIAIFFFAQRYFLRGVT
ncbi:MAG: hypothetical protein H0W66_11110 [Chthoniobacterales bacterium]|nr:hypothetical protein [Chthoniobacterales bacterium]